MLRNESLKDAQHVAALVRDVLAKQGGYVCLLDPLNRVLIDGSFDLVACAEQLLQALSNAEKN